MDDAFVMSRQVPRGQQRVFHASLAGSVDTNHDWLARKSRAVAKHNCSSWALGCQLRADEFDYYTESGYPGSDIATAGGAVPLRVNGSLIRGPHSSVERGSVLWQETVGVCRVTRVLNLEGALAGVVTIICFAGRKSKRAQQARRTRTAPALIFFRPSHIGTVTKPPVDELLGHTQDVNAVD